MVLIYTNIYEMGYAFTPTMITGVKTDFLHIIIVPA